MKIVDVEQNSSDWFQARAGKVTASEADAIVSPTFKIRDSKGVDTYLAQKLAERWLGGSIAGYQSADMELGQMLESEARSKFELRRDVAVRRVGLCLTDDERCGASPDGLVGDDSGLELKCPLPHTHCAYILAGELPDAYRVQVEMSMFVTGRPTWHFASYCRGFPMFELLIERDAEKQKIIAEAVSRFLERYDAAYQRMCEINGGPPRQRAPLTYTPKPQPTTDPYDPNAIGITP